MVLQSLAKYYEILSADPDSNIPKSGYNAVNVSYALNISKDGELHEIIPTMIPVKRGKKMVEISQTMELPERVPRANGIKPNFLCDNSSYVLGIDNKGKPTRTKQCFESFKDLHNQILLNIKNDYAQALINFLNSWDVENAQTHPAVQEHLENIIKGANIVFKLDGGRYIHEDEEIKKAWDEYSTKSSDGKIMQCLVTGEEKPIARIHPAIKGVKGAQSSGASLVSFNKSAYESFGKKDGQGINSPVSEEIAFAYTTALNHLLSDDANRIYIGDAAVIFWAISSEKKYQDMASIFVNPSEISESEEEKATQRDPAAIREVRSIFDKIAKGEPIRDFGEEFDKDVEFYTLGLSPNAARLSVRFFTRDNFLGFIQKSARHYEDMRIERQFSNEFEFVPIWKVLSETVPATAKDKTPQPQMSGSVMRAILTGVRYPTAIFNAIMMRIKADRNINYYRASIIKAYLIRNYKEKYREVITVSLNTETNNKAYVLGRLFAVLEKAQLDASETKLKSTIKDKYFTSASATPGRVFPILLRLSQHHIAKAEYGYTSDKRIEELMQKLEIEENPMPTNLSLEDQGIFVLGYYHQRNAFYVKKDKDSDNKNEEEN
ncbi:MAG: type I-C CRISPR-associated protein Cas8c/Csd1 [Clostridiales bacterium]|nr:type I-C CRISPR-associated protein Cas8c/Csd1 [Clostridiales bacterium]